MGPAHDINFNEVKLLCEEKRCFSWIIQETINIEKNVDNFNKDDCYSLANSWKHVLRGEKDTRKNSSPTLMT
jgi:hypothetical protein